MLPYSVDPSESHTDIWQGLPFGHFRANWTPEFLILCTLLVSVTTGSLRLVALPASGSLISSNSHLKYKIINNTNYPSPFYIFVANPNNYVTDNI